VKCDGEGLKLHHRDRDNEAGRRSRGQLLYSFEAGWESVSQSWFVARSQVLSLHILLQESREAGVVQHASWACMECCSAILVPGGCYIPTTV
jgi:hypothetical protein